MPSINSREYWNSRFGTGDWIVKGGATQSLQHARHFVPLLNIPHDFSGSICDFGCAEGDAFPVYRESFPNAQLIGVDFSPIAIEKAKRKYNTLASFVCGEVETCPNADVVICAHTLEHLQGDVEVLSTLLAKCRTLYIVVPFKESPLGSEHLRSYDEQSFSPFNPRLVAICNAGWQYNGLELLYQVYLKNLARPFLGKAIVRQSRQIVFGFRGHSPT